MCDWFVLYGGSLLVAMLLSALVILIILSIRRDKKQGKSSCGAACAGCPMSGRCHEQQKEKNDFSNTEQP